MKNIGNAILIVAAFSLVFGCKEGGQFREEKIFAGGIRATKAQLNHGQQVYTEYCMPCHGVNGDGKGVASKGMKVPPRDFTKGIFKFGQVPAGELPHDQHLFELLTNGLHGTAMLPWDLKEGQMFAVISYIKTFAPQVWEGKEKELGREIIATNDPFGEAHKSAAIQLGKEIYHAKAQCQSCHRGYVGLNELSAINEKMNGEKVGKLETDFYQVKPQDTEWGFKSIPPDFTWDSVRSASSVEQLYVRLSSGVGGTAMPSWRETISDEEIWAVAHYVRDLMDFKDRAKRKELMDSIKSDNYNK